MTKKCIILSDNVYRTGSTEATTINYRNIGALEVARRFREHQYDTTVIEWFSSWEHQDLQFAIEAWLADADQAVIAVSVTFNTEIIFTISDILNTVKKDNPKVKIIVGGNRTHDTRLDFISDYVFIGRSMEILEQWLSEQSLNNFYTSNPNVLVNRNVNFNKDTPVIPEITDGDMLTEHDVLGFEVGVGCKFNCSFCSFDLRGVRDPLLAESENIRKFLQDAYDKYGVKNFYIADDTINEQDRKLEILARAVESLSYKPNIACFARLDLFEARPQQYDLLKRCNIRALTFGIETFNGEAAKLIRKPSNTENLFIALEKIKHTLPECFTTTGLIVGLAKDSADSIIAGLDRLIDQQLITGVNVAALNIQKSRTEIYDDNFLSNIAKDPEKFGYELLGELDDCDEYNKANGDRPDSFVTLNWKNDWCDTARACALTVELNEKIRNERMPGLDGFYFLTLMALGMLHKRSDYKIASSSLLMTNKISSKIQKQKKQYIQDKLQYIRDNA